MTIKIDAERAYALMTEAVAERGEDFTYQDRDGVCVYAYDGQPDCLVGLALSKAGVSTETLEDMGGTISSLMNDRRLKAAGFDLTADAVDVFAEGQEAQDNGQTWGEAMDTAKSYMETVASLDAE